MAKEKKERKKSIFKIILSSLLTILLFISISAMFCLMPLQYMMSDKYVEDIVSDIDIANFDISSFNGSKEEVTVSDYVYSFISAHKEEFPNISEDDVDNMVNDELVKEFLSDEFGDVYSYVLTGDGNPKIKNQDVEDLFAEEIKAYTGNSLTDDQEFEVHSFVKKMQLDKVSKTSLESSIVIPTSYLNFTSVTLLLIADFLITALLVVAIWALNLDAKRRSFLFYAIPSILSGVAFSLLLLCSSYIADYIATEGQLPIALADAIVKSIGSIVSIPALGFLVFGLVSVIVFLILNGIAKMKAKKEEKVAAKEEAARKEAEEKSKMEAEAKEAEEKTAEETTADGNAVVENNANENSSSADINSANN